MMHGLVEFLDCVDAHAHFVLSCLGAPGRGDFLCVLHPVSPAQCRAGL